MKIVDLSKQKQCVDLLAFGKSKHRLASMIYIEIDEFRMWPDGVLAKAELHPVTIRENGLRLGVLLPPNLFDLHELYEKEYWTRPVEKKRRPDSNSLS